MYSKLFQVQGKMDGTKKGQMKALKKKIKPDIPEPCLCYAFRSMSALNKLSLLISIIQPMDPHMIMIISFPVYFTPLYYVTGLDHNYDSNSNHVVLLDHSMLVAMYRLYIRLLKFNRDI
ncbi:hypothetical protein DERP_002965 [Dermatophagoides pteronyssinus]|uniref:Uncharacterized protein n=1 Tax=Dermatophagoides pteronyssinus TaxID=6956 RepID=A0ABQ8JWR2_DERPT|nr:hypothetical protein DERP_002965 [Dermatophagoides pteronyssinus]